MLPFLNAHQSLTVSPLFPFPIRELEEGQSQGRGLGLNSQHSDVTPASMVEMMLAEAIADGSSVEKLTSP